MTKENKFYYLSNDVTFKYLFKNPKTKVFFEEIIKYYTDIDVSNFEFFDNELTSGNEIGNYRLDSILVNKDKSIILNVEMNRKYSEYQKIRNRRYLHKIAGNVCNSENYNKEVEVIQLNFNCYYCKEDRDISSSTHMLRDIENNLVEEDFKIHNLYIPKIVKSCYNKLENKLKLFLCDSYEKMRELVKEDEELKVVVEEIKKLNKDKYFGALYNVAEEQEKLERSAREEGKQEGIVIGLEQGLEQGAQVEKEEIAKSMLEKDLDINLISEITNLSIEEIENLNNQ